jgi:SAM-dependent methyltransferase
MNYMDEQKFYYRNWRGRLIGNKAREQLVLDELKSIRANDFFLEVGCAQGHFESHALKYCGNVFGADFSLEKLKAARSNAKNSFFVAMDAEMLPFKKSSFDFVLCTEVLEHVPEWKKALLELQRVGRKKILITVPLEKSVFWRALSLGAPMKGRGHLHKLDSRQIKAAIGNDLKLVKYKLVATPSRKLNRLVGNRLGEKAGIFAMMLFEKTGKKAKNAK